MTQNILITGGFGTLGSRLSQILSLLGNVRVRIASRFAQNPPHWAPNSETCAVNFDDNRSIRTMLNDISTIVHLAALNDQECREAPDLAQLVNVEYTNRIIECLPTQSNVRFIYVSTSQVYGNNLNGIINESSPTNPSGPYSATHLAAENLVQHAINEKKVSGSILRLANGFGTPMQAEAKIWQILVNDLCRQAVETGKLRLKSTGTQFRNFITFTDICTALTFFATNDHRGLYNLGGNTTMRIIDMAELISKQCLVTLNFRPPIEKPDFDNSPPPTAFEYDSSKLMSTGLILENNLVKEIDSLLKSCKQWFGTK